MTAEPKSSGAPPMLSRFGGEDGRKLLLDVLGDTSLLRGVEAIDAFVNGCDLVEVPEGGRIIEQGGSDNDLYVIISGSVDVVVNGRRLTTRRAGSHVGEMALIDPTARRSSTLVATEPCLLLKCPEKHFATSAQTHPKLWRRLAVELSRRLHERDRLIRPPRSQPVLFIGCSTESLPVAREVQSAFSYDPIVVHIWTDGVFNASKTPIEDLTDLVSRIDLAVILLTPDDKIGSRGEENFGPRDNVVFELGLCIGAIGRSRTLLLVPRGNDFRIPSDLLGVKPLDYPPGDASTITSRLGPACTEIRKIVNRLGPI